ncbi:MAG TPA: DUF4920 domain-containing protein [Clostridia bacterium]|nr:DUF4920 domain-containing protein [Clostridia bacterium]
MKRASIQRVFVFVTVFILGLTAWAGETKLGNPLKLKETVSIKKLVVHRDQYAGKDVQVKGKVTEVCQKAGCWMVVMDDKGNAVKIKVKDGEIVFPKDAAGKMATVEGKFVKTERTREEAIQQAKHEAEEKKLPFDESKAKIETVTYQIQATGAVISD